MIGNLQNDPQWASAGVKRIDLHCHSKASCDGAEAVLEAIGCPECYSEPTEVYAQATRRGMDFVTLTDHDTINGAVTLTNRDNFLVGEELSCYFPEDGCKMHVVLWGITREDHNRLQAMANDIYACAEYIEKNHIAHAVAHPVYRQNDKLERWHLERLLLIFKGFECLNGAHSGLHRTAFEPMLDKLSRHEIGRLAEKHQLRPHWPEPWNKARTGGSDDHGLLNIGLTFTEFPADTKTTQDVLNCLREGRCRPGGESGSSNKLAHAFYGVAVRYYGRRMLPQGAKPNLAARLLQTIVGDGPAPTRGQIIRQVLSQKIRHAGSRVLRPWKRTGRQVGNSGMIAGLFVDALRNRIGQHPSLLEAVEKGLPPLGEHEEMSRFVAGLDRDVTRSIAHAFQQFAKEGCFTGLFDAVSAVLTQQFVLVPYYFALFHQNRERHLLRQITGQLPPVQSHNMKVGLFTDTLDDINGVARFIAAMARQAGKANVSLTVHTCNDHVSVNEPWRKTFTPVLSGPMPYYPGLTLNLPPIREVLEWADKQQFDAIHISTPGAMGLCGWLVAKMLRIPIVGTYHTDFPAYAERLTGDHKLGDFTAQYMKWIYSQMRTVFSRSGAYMFNLRELGIPEGSLAALPPCVDLSTFHPQPRDRTLLNRLGITQKNCLLYCGRVSKEKNLPMLVEVFRRLSRNDTALLVVGDGPYLEEMKKSLAGTPAYFAGAIPSDQVAKYYTAADLLVFPSRTDTLGQVVLEAAACGVPAVVTFDGGPRDLVEQDVTGLLVAGDSADLWLNAIRQLLDDPARLHRLGYAAAEKVQSLSETATFQAFWSAHAKAVQADQQVERIVVHPSKPKPEPAPLETAAA